MWKVINSGKGSAEKNMAIDAKLLSELSPDGSPILHLYDWEEECATYGHFLKPHTVLDMKQATSRGMKIVKRPTGGGIIFHMYDFAFSVIVPANCNCFCTNTLDNYHFINSKVKEAIKKHIHPNHNLTFLFEPPPPLDRSCANFCMAMLTKYDLVVGDKKIVGAAQRRQKQGYLHQGSIAIALPKKDLLRELLLPGTRVEEAMFRNTFFILDEGWSSDDLQNLRATLKRELQKEFIQ